MRKLTTFTLLMLAMQAVAQLSSYQLWTDNSMSLYRIRCVAQDKTGFIWMGAGNGLYRYDGYHYQKLHDNGTPSLLPDESVQGIVNWGDRYLWVRLRGNLYTCYDIDRDSFVDWSGNATNTESYRNFTITNDHNLWLYDSERGCRHVSTDNNGTFTIHDYQEADGSLPSDNIRFIIQSKDGNKTWIGTDKGLACIQQGKSSLVVKQQDFVCTQQGIGDQLFFLTRQGDIYRTTATGVTHEYTAAHPSLPPVRNVAFSPGNLIITTEGPTMNYDLRQRKMTVHPYIHIEKAQIVNDNKDNKVLFDHDGTDLWYFTPQQTYHLTNIYSKELTRQNAGGRFRFVFGSYGIIWISTYGNGLFAYDTRSKSMTHYLYRDALQPLIASDYLLNIFEDKSGQLWVCHENHGIRIIKTNRHQTEQLYFTTAADNGHANNIRLIKPISDHIYVGNRLNDMWIADRRMQNIQQENPYGDDVVAATTDRQGRIWIGTRKKGVFVDGQQLGPIMTGKVSDILCDSKNRIWVSMFDGGLELVTTATDGVMTVRSFFKGKQAITNPRSMLQDKQGRIWFCSNNGICLFQPDQLIKNDTAYRHINVSGNNMNTDEVHCLYEDSRQHIWAGTTGHGLVCLNYQGEIVKRYTTKDGLPNDRIESLIEDKDGNLWIGTDYGLAKYQTKDSHIYSFFLSSNELGRIYTEGCATLLDDGRLAMGTLHGMQVFNPKTVNPEPNIFPLSITDLHVNGISLQDMGDNRHTEAALNKLDQLTLSHRQNSLTFFFSDFEFAGNDIVKYAYLLEGYDKEWSKLTTQNFATYKNLSPGTYTLRVRSYNIWGMLSDHEATLQVVIRQPWWNTWWAWLIYLMAAGTVAWLVWKQLRRIEDLRTKIQVENQLTEFKLRFFTNISHEFRTPLTIIRSAMDRISQQGELPGTLKQPINSMQKSTDRLLRLINELLEFRKIQNEKLQLSLEETDIIEFLRNIFLSFNETAGNRQINYQFATFAREYRMYIDRNYVDKMAYNLLSNAFKYTMRRNSITLRIKQEGQRLLFEVEDTGIGVPKEKQADLFTRFNQSAFSRESIGIGLHMVSELVRVHHGEIAFRENPSGQGSIFSISLPIDKTVYQDSDFLATESELMKDNDQQATDSHPAVSYKEVESPPLNDHLILVVDDDDDMREHISSELHRYFVTDTACDGEEALEKIRQQRPSLVVSDVRMPGMNGFELTRKIRQDKELSDLPVILLTGIADEEKQVRGTEYGADDYLFKPFNTKVLVAKCSTLITQREKLRMKYAKEVVGTHPLADIIVEDADKKFLERFENWVYAHMERPDMQAMDFANSMKMGRTTFFKKVKQVTGMPPHEYIKKIRMKRAAELLKDPTVSVSEAAYKTGFDDPNYFSRSFKEYYGVTASQFKKGKNEQQESDQNVNG